MSSTLCVEVKTATSYRELEARKSRVRDLEKVYMDMAMQKELQKSGRKRKLREEELVNPTTKPVYNILGLLLLGCKLRMELMLHSL
ncbi:hypothetical protein KY285_006167 [Solanum tuberosum]|nr:hypothetical protein KY289_006664 [Solanum tuberosum]KAH0753019.1 hypothetical protein KY285_006167 [Solanum tuberosum]